jgi:hypothetical protein
VEVGDGTTSSYDKWKSFEYYDLITEVHVLEAESIVAGAAAGVCQAVQAIADTGIWQTSAAATQAASRWVAGYGIPDKVGCGEICGIEYISGVEPLIDEGTIQINHASHGPNGSYAGAIKSIKAISTARDYSINDGEIQIPYANKETSVYGVIGDVQEHEDATAIATLENGVLKLPKNNANIKDIKYDENVPKPTIVSGMIKLSIANSGGTGAEGQLGGMRGVSIMPELTGPTITKGVLELNPASSPTSMGLVANISSDGTELKIDKGTINIPKADKASSRPGLISNIEASSDSTWNIENGAIKVALADNGSAGLIKSVKVEKGITEPSISSGEITIPLGAYEFLAPWLEETNGQVRFVESQLDAKAAALAPTISSKIVSTASASIDTYTDTSSSPPNGPSGTIGARIDTTSGTTATATFSTNPNS